MLHINPVCLFLRVLSVRGVVGCVQPETQMSCFVVRDGIKEWNVLNHACKHAVCTFPHYTPFGINLLKQTGLSLGKWAPLLNAVV